MLQFRLERIDRAHSATCTNTHSCEMLYGSPPAERVCACVHVCLLVMEKMLVETVQPASEAFALQLLLVTGAGRTMSRRWRHDWMIAVVR